MNYRRFTHSYFSLLVALLFSAVAIQAQDFNYTDAWGKSGFTLETQNRSNVQINYSIEKFSLTDTRINGAAMQNIALPGILLPNNEGAPDLPGVSRYLAIPEGAKASLNVIDFRVETIQNIEMAPAPRIPLDTDEGPLHFEKGKVYSENSFYPTNPFQLSEVTEIRGVDVVMLGITPFQYNPVTKELKVYHDIKLEVNFEGGSGEFGDTRLRSRWWDPIMQDAFLNHASLPKVDYNKQHQQVSKGTRDVGYEYLIVVPSDPAYAQWADSIKTFRQKQGILTGIVTLQEIGGTSVNILENYFNDAYANWDIPPAAVLLIGDYGTNGTNSIISPIWDGYCASDNIFADVNNNDMPDIIFARMTAQNASQLEVMVTKMLNYERNPPTNADFYKKPITALGWQTERWFQICSETVGGFWRETQGKEPVRINAVYSGQTNVWSTATNTSSVLSYFGPSGLAYIPSSPNELGGWSGGTANMVVNAINDGSFALQHRDHGFESGWGEPAFQSSHINSLTNTEDNELPFIFSINCLTGKYNMSSECFTEKFHRHTSGGENAGALGLIAASEVSYSFVNDTYVWGMFDNMWPEFMPDYGMPVDERGLMPAFGNAAGKYFLQQSSWPYNTNNKEVTYNLFHHHGGAFLTMYSEVPQEITATHNPVLISGETTFNVNTEVGTFISLTVNGEIIGTAEGTGAPVSIAIESQLPPNTMLVTITKTNRFRYESNVEIIPPSGPYVVYNLFEIDDAQGNGNGLMDFGENILLDMTIENVGVETALNVIATITCEDEYITLVNATADFGDIDASSTKTLAGAFEIEAAENIPDGRSLAFTISASNGTDSWESFFSIVAHAPQLEVTHVSLVETSGNFNGLLDPGESADIMFETSNSGSSDAMNVMASVITSSPFLTLNNSSADLEDLTIGESAVATFNVTVDEAAPIGNVVDMVFTAQSGMYQVQKLTGFKVGLIIEDFETGDFDNYEWEHSGSSDWTITSSGAYEGTYAAKSGSINDMQESNLSITMEVMNDDEISFYHKVSSESSYDYLRFYIDGIVVDEWAGNTSWVQSSYPVTAGEHTFKWAYEKDQSVANGSDCGWIDYISFPAAASDAMIVYAGPDAETCDGDDYTTNATGSNYESIMWTTSGTGLFNDNTLMNPTYTPSSDDISNGYVMLTITGYQDGNEMSDEMELSFMEMPGQCAAPEGATELCVNPGITTYQTQQMLYVDDYMWELTPAEAGTITFDGMSAEVTWSAYFIGNAQIKVMGTNSCGDGEMSEPLDVSIMDIPQMAATPTGSYELCVNPGTINYEVAEVTNATAYVWELLPEDAGTITTENRTAQISWSESFTGIAQLKVMGTNLCGDGEMSEPLDVSIMNLPQMGSVPTGDVNLCDSDLTSVYATDEITDATEYIWMLVPTEAGTLSGNNMEVQVSWSDGWVGEAELSVKGANACGQGNPSDYLMVTRSTVPAQAGNISGPTEVCQGLNVTFDVAEISAATECEWVIEPAEAGMLNMDDNSCDIVFSSTWEGTATLMTRGINNCGNGEWSESFTLIVEDCTGIDEKNSANLSVYPNPNNGTFNISITGNESVDVKLVNAIGEVVYLENGVQINGNTNKNIETSDLANGIYYLHIHGQTMNSMEKIIVNK